jgi:MFS family permease
LANTHGRIKSRFQAPRLANLTRDACYTSLNIGMGESYFAAFMIALGISDVNAGLGTIVPQFIGVIFQLFSIRSFFTQYSLKKRLIIFLSLQSLAMIPLVAAGIFKINSALFIILILGIYWASLLSLNPPWNRLIGHTVPIKFRLKFFAIRNQFSQFSVFIGLIGSGVALYFAKESNSELPVYVAIFSCGLILKCMSIYEIKNNHIDYTLAPGSEQRVRFRNFIKGIRKNEQGKLINFLFFFYVTVYFSAPYFNPYMLTKLNFNYIEYMAVTSISYFGRLFTLKILQNRAKSRHINKILMLASLGICTSPLLWAISQKYWWIVLIEFLSGCSWAGFELSTILLYYQKIDDRERTSVLTYITFFNTTGMVCGSLLGALFMKILPIGYDSYLALFAFSSLIRAIIVIFAPLINFRGEIPKLISFNRAMLVRPPFSAFTRPFIGKINLNRKKKK